jgi:hypothetical protein
MCMCVHTHTGDLIIHSVFPLKEGSGLKLTGIKLDNSEIVSVKL